MNSQTVANDHRTATIEKAGRLFAIAKAVGDKFWAYYGKQTLAEGGVYGTVNVEGFADPMTGHCQLDPESGLPISMKVQSWSRTFGSSFNLFIQTDGDRTTITFTSQSGGGSQFAGWAGTPVSTREVAVFDPEGVSYRSKSFQDHTRIAS